MGIGEDSPASDLVDRASSKFSKSLSTFTGRLEIGTLFQNVLGETRTVHYVILGAAALTALGTLGAILSLSPTVWAMAWKGSASFSSDAGTFAVPWQTRLGILALAFLIPAIPTFLVYQVTKLDSSFRIAERAAIERQVLLATTEKRLQKGIDRILASARQRFSAIDRAYEIAALSFKVSELSRELTEVRSLTTSTGDIAIIGSRQTKLTENSTEIHIVDQKTAIEKLIVIIHLFDGVAYWEFQSSTLFVGPDNVSDVSLWRLLSTPEARAELERFDVVIGIGLQSKTTQLDQNLSQQRAGFLCSGLHGLLESNAETQALGLDVGAYQGALSETENRQDPTQRPVILVGVDLIDPNVEYSKFVQELLSSVRVSGLDLGLFENLSADKYPLWIPPPNCDTEFSFMNRQREN